MSAQWLVRRVHLASIDVKSEGSILLEETVIRRLCAFIDTIYGAFKEICVALRVVRENFTRPSSPVVSREGCGL